jgi:hypothetical protein
MKSRVGLAFRPGVATLIGMDVLEYRQLLSAVGKAGEVEAVDRSHAVVSSPPVARGDAPSADAKEASSPQTGDSPRSKALSVQPATSSASQVASEADTESGDAREAVSRAVAMFAQPGASSVTPGRASVGLSSSVEQTPADEGATGVGADPSVAEQPGAVGSTISAVAPPGVAAQDAGFGASTSPGPGPVPAWSGPTAYVGAGARPANDGPSGVRAGPDGTLLTTDGTATGPAIAVAARVRMTAGSDIPEMGTRSSADGEIIGPRDVQEPTPPPRCADLLTEFLPFDRAVLEDAIDHFLAPLEDLGTELVNWSPSAGLLPAATLVATAALAMEAVRQRIRGGQAVGEEADEDFARFPGYPKAWRLGES